ncbi:MAG: CopD family protein, partial [Sciscionella sp.]
MPTAVQAAVTWLGLCGLFLLTGPALMGLLGGGVATAERPRRVLRGMVAGGGVGVLAGIVGELLAAWYAAGWGSRALLDLAGGDVGRWWWVRLAAIPVVVLGWARTGRRGGHGGFGIMAAGVMGIVLTFAATSHPAASPLPAMGLGFAFVHVLAATTWIGGVIGLGAVLAAGRGWLPPDDRRSLLERFSVVAGMAVAAVLLTGAGNAILELGGISDLVNSPFGLALLAKLVLLAALLVVAARNAAALVAAVRARRPGRDGLLRAVVVEAVLGLAVLVPTAVMSVEAPALAGDQARAAQAQADSDPAQAFSGSTQLDGGTAELSLTPGGAGVNAARIEVDGRDPAPSLRIAMSGPASARATAMLDRSGYDHDPATHTIYQGALTLSRAGNWHAVLRQTGSAGESLPLLVTVSAMPSGPAKQAAAQRMPWLAVVALVGAGAVGIFIGVAMLAPAVARPLSGLLGRPLAALLGTAGKLGPCWLIRSGGEGEVEAGEVACSRSVQG